MSRLTESPAWRALAAHAETMRQVRLASLFDADPKRFERYSARACGLLLDYSKNPLNGPTLKLLLNLAEQQDVARWRRRMFAGEAINNTEGRAVLHTALRNRSGAPVLVDGVDVMPGVREVLGRMGAFVAAVRSGEWKGADGRRIRTVVNLGIGGSDLGPAMAAQALAPYARGPVAARFVSNVDGAHLTDTLLDLDPAETLFVVASKTFTTQETMANAQSARAWLVGRLGEAAVARHFAAVSANVPEAARFGIPAENVFGFWDWVGGRYSLWSAIGLPLALAVGMENFEDMLAGAHAMDRHFQEAAHEANLPLILALVGVWHASFLGRASLAVLPYDQRLARLPAYLQQLEMESNGKRVTRDGLPVDYPTCPVVWGEPGTNGQHAFYQLLHQGTQVVPADFIAAVEADHGLPGHHAMLLANFLAQPEALMRGRSEAEARAQAEKKGLPPDQVELLARHRAFPGDRPSNAILFKRLTPHTLGALLALYEHKAFVQGVIWELNSFDQWGVELGKELAGVILPELEGTTRREHDGSTAGLLSAMLARD